MPSTARCVPGRGEMCVAGSPTPWAAGTSDVSSRNDLQWSDGWNADIFGLTRETRLENGPSDARGKVRILTGGSIAIMCPA